MPLSGAPIDVIDSFQVFIGRFSGAPVSVIDSFSVSIESRSSGAPVSVIDSFTVGIRRINSTFDFTIAGKTFNLPFARFKFAAHSAYALDAPKIGPRRGAPRAKPSETISGEWMPERTADFIRNALRNAVAPVFIAFTDEAGMLWSAILVRASFEPVLGTIFVSYKLHVIITAAPTAIMTIPT